MTRLRLGSLCSGYGGLDLAVAQVLDVEPAWFADPDPGAAAILAHHWPDVPNLGDITAVDWTTVPPIDVLAAGFPCQDISYAGRGAGIKEGTRSGLWHVIADALSVVRPRLVVLENVAAIVARRPGLDVVLADLAALGFDASWCCVRASDVGAPHRRERWFCIAWPADADRTGLERRGLRGATPERCEPAADPACDGRDEGRPESARLVRRLDVALRRDAAADPESVGHGDARPASVGGLAPTVVASAVADADRDPVREQPVPVAGSGGPSVAELDGVVWGHYGPAIDRWARVLGRPAPAPTEPGRDGRPRLSPVFVEWLMGLDEGHVTGVPGLSRNAQLKALGNGVVPQQGAAALAHLIARIETAA